jgi:GNAT superfamily N-acetyltransferase
MITSINSADLADITAMWRESFHDEESYIHAFLTQYKDVFGLKYQIDGLTVSMLFMIPCCFAGKHGYYIYACATLKSFQGHNFMAALLEAAFQKAKSEQAFGLILIPAEASLFNYYKKHGFETGTFISEQMFYKKDRIDSDFSYEKTNDIERIIKLRNKIYSENSAIQFKENHIAFIQSQYLSNRGSMLVFSNKTKEGYALCYYNQDTEMVHVMEWALISDDAFKDLPALVTQISRFFNVSTVLVRSKSRGNAQTDMPFTMIRHCDKPIDARNLYFNLGLD